MPVSTMETAASQLAPGMRIAKITAAPKATAAKGRAYAAMAGQRGWTPYPRRRIHGSAHASARSRARARRARSRSTPLTRGYRFARRSARSV
jgi:hypothetical protein